MAIADLGRAVLEQAFLDARSPHELRRRAALAWLLRPGDAGLAFWASVADVNPDFVQRLARSRRP